MFACKTPAAAPSAVPGLRRCAAGRQWGARDNKLQPCTIPSPAERGTKPTKILTRENTASWRLRPHAHLTRPHAGVRCPARCTPARRQHALHCRESRSVPGRVLFSPTLGPAGSSRGKQPRLGREGRRFSVYITLLLSRPSHNFVAGLGGDVGSDRISNVLFSGVLTIC